MEYKGGGSELAAASLGFSVSALQRQRWLSADPARLHEEIAVCGCWLWLPLVLLAALLLSLGKIRIFRDAVGFFVLVWGCSRGEGAFLFEQECNKIEWTFSFSLQFPLSPFTFSTREVRHYFASSFPSCGCLFLNLSLFVISFFPHRRGKSYYCHAVVLPVLNLRGQWIF